MFSSKTLCNSFELRSPSPFHHFSISTWLDVLGKKAGFSCEDERELELRKVEILGKLIEKVLNVKVDTLM